MKLGKALKKEKVEKLYFVAIVPPSPIYEEAFEQKVYFKTKYNSKASLNSPPHITLHMPFKWVEKNEDEIVSHLKTFAHENASVAIKLNGFSSFPPGLSLSMWKLLPSLSGCKRILRVISNDN